MHNAGWIKVHRGLWDDPLFRGHPARVGAWLWLVGHARWKAGPYDINGHIVVLERGQLCVSRSQLADALGWSESAVERFLTRLKSGQMIERNTEHGRSVITICNYERLQGDCAEGGQAVERATGQRPDSRRTAKEEGKIGKKVSERADALPETPRAQVCEQFEFFWKSYPRRIGKAAAQKAWDKAVKRGVSPDRLIAAAQRYAAHPPDETRFIPYPAAWLHQGRYDDEDSTHEQSIQRHRRRNELDRVRHPAARLLDDCPGGLFAPEAAGDPGASAGDRGAWSSFPTFE